MSVETLLNALESIAPPRYAEPWDNVGLLIGSRSWPADRVVLTIDLTEAVLHEAIDAGAQTIVAYHPPIFTPMTRMTNETRAQRIALAAAQAGIAVYSPHTALDAAPGGVNDWLAGGLGSGDVRALTARATLPPTEEFKLVTFCPHEAVDALRNGLAAVGAGRIGAYELCSFELRGTGTFRGGEGTRPVLGRAGVLEQVPETRLEMVCPGSALALAVLTLRQLHPYEEPPIEIYALQPRPARNVGEGRRVVLDQKAGLRELVERIKKHLGVSTVRVAVAPGAPRRFGTLAACAGAGGSLLDRVIEQGCELFLTGEMRHHDVLDAQGRGCTVVLAGHTNTERGYLRVLRKKLAALLRDVTITISKTDGDPLKAM